MKNNILLKIKLGVFLFIISLIYFYFFWFLSGRLMLFLPPALLLIIFYSFIAVFIYPYIKINSQNIIKRGLFFGLIVWIVNFTAISINLGNILVAPDFSGIFSFILTPVYFIIIGLILSFCYKKFLPEEFNLSLQKLKFSFIKIIIAAILTVLIYYVSMYFFEIFLYKKADIFGFVKNFIISPLDYRFYFIPLIRMLISTIIYNQTFRRANISKNMKWILFGLFTAFFTTVSIQISEYLLPAYIGPFVIPAIRRSLFLPHFVSLFLISYIFSRLLNGTSSNQALSKE